MHSEVTQHIKEASEESNTMFLILGHPLILSDTSFVELPVGLGFQASVTPLPEHAVVKAMNNAVDERRKKDKDDKEVRRWARLNRGKRR